MPAEGLCLRLAHTGSVSSQLVLSDIHDGVDARNQRVNNLRPGAIYISPGQTVDLVYTSDVAKSYEVGAIRTWIGQAVLTAAFFIGAGLNATLMGNPIRVTTTTYTIQEDEGLILVDQGDEAPVTITLPPGSEHLSGDLIIKDKKGTAGTWNITINASGRDTIDGGTSTTIRSNWASRRLVFFDGEWSII